MPIQTILEADEFFASLPDGPDAVADFAAALPPAGAAAYIPVAGTAGKTATASLTAGILTAAGFCTGLYKAGAGPLSDRILVDGAPLAPGSAAAGAYLDAAGNILENTLLNRPAAELAAACAVTHIGPDGSGRSIERLAHDAAAVMRQGTVCVTAPGQPKAALTEIIVAAGKADCELVVPEEEDITFPEEGEDSKVDYGGYEVPPAFPGYHAACNAAIAVELALALWRKGFDIPDEAILSALAAAQNPSSIRILSQQPLVVLDACRTPQQAAALLRVLQNAQVRGLSAVVGLETVQGAEAFFSTLESGQPPEPSPKDRSEMPGMGEGGPIERLFVTVPPGADPALAQTLADAARFHFEVEVCPSLPEALDAARAASSRGLLVCGSEALALAAGRLLAEG